MPTYDFDFQRYVERKKGAREAERREGAGYAYAGDLRIRRVIDRARPVTLSLEATVRLWRATARAELLGTAIKVTEASFPRLQRLAQLSAERLHVTPPPLYVSPHAGIVAATFGTDDEPTVVLHAGLADALSDEELLHVLGAELGRIQNRHVLLETARYYLHRASSRFGRFIVRPAVASLDAWARRAEVTADRAGLIASRDLDASVGAIEKLAEAAPAEGEGPHGEQQDGADGEHGAPDGAAVSVESAAERAARRRAAALAVFARSAWFRGVLGERGGLSPSETDAETARAMKGAA